MAKHPSNGSKNRDVGHAWFYLEGSINGKKLILEGGHSGELGIDQPTYSQGLLENIALGANDPVRYLFCALEDGFFQKGSGGHKPTFSAKKNLTEEEMERVVKHVRQYPFPKYSLTGKQCCTLIQEMADLFGIHLSIEKTIHIPQNVKIGKKWVTLWNDKAYSSLTFACPDLLEQELKRAVAGKQLEPGPKWRKSR